MSDSLAIERDKTQNDLSIRIEQITHLEQDVARLNRERQELFNENQRTQEDWRTLSAEHFKLKEALHVGTARNEDLEERLTNATEAFEAMHKSYQQEAEAHKAMAAKFVHCQNELDSERAANNMLAQERDEYRKSLEAYRARDLQPYDSNKPKVWQPVTESNEPTPEVRNVRIIEYDAIGTEAIQTMLNAVTPWGSKLSMDTGIEMQRGMKVVEEHGNVDATPHKP